MVASAAEEPEAVLLLGRLRLLLLLGRLLESLLWSGLLLLGGLYHRFLGVDRNGGCSIGAGPLAKREAGKREILVILPGS